MSQSPHVSLVNAIAASVNDDASIANFDDSVRASIGKVVCVGRNYAEHARELGNEIPKSPILFMKPASSVVSVRNDIVRPNPVVYGDTHYEAELCIQLAADLSAATAEQAKLAIGSVTVGLDLTLRDLQSKLKEKGYPWERAKCFDGACVLADWLEPQAFGDFSQVQYQLTINDELRQDGDSALMLFSVYELLAEISHAFSLQAGDVIMTGTPSGVGILQADDKLTLKLGEHEWQVQVR
ncbi:fumarylacetoacetate hydrolase family protein [Psychrobacter aquaticus]|uniref:Fumarylacetoacetate hydrolase family protein n=1 Tax=Psychrobacter aquaticus CMS 56 TaxID=1354303 RepID=U4T9Q4_9GAMM|nr:fumarylacetoacetate hydrolase family protein [Psychrobacter aquaticus]ERL55449.1 Fumarylacetoacetate hydrolase family protein [Psychrobacter aquaticus CMS 56]